MITFPNAKINLGLRVTGKRSDGFHNLETVFYPVGMSDVLEIISLPEPKKNGSSKVSFSSSGIEIPGETNLCEKAAYLLAESISISPAGKKNLKNKIDRLQIHLHKMIPVGAGLGGGSSDGAFTLSMVNQLLELGLSKNKLIRIASELGSDCPFFLENKPVFATGRGTDFSPLSLSLENYFILLVIPEIHISTAWAFSQIVPEKPDKNLNDLIRLPVKKWKNEIINDFEIPVFKKFPELKGIKDKLYAMGAAYCSMSGSGSAFYGIFEKQVRIENQFKGCMVRMETKEQN